MYAVVLNAVTYVVSTTASSGGQGTLQGDPARSGPGLNGALQVLEAYQSITYGLIVRH